MEQEFFGKAKLAKVKRFDKSVDDANRIILEPKVNLIVIHGFLAERIAYFRAPLKLVAG